MMTRTGLLITFACALACRASAPPLPSPPPSAPGSTSAAPAPDEDAPTLAGGASAARPLAERPEMAWWRASMETREQRLPWWREARFGMFMHWGVYSALGGVWEGQPVRGYAEHIQRIRKIPRAQYLEQAAGRFNPTGFDADAWIAAARQAGMGYFIITAKHHDGFAMFDSAVSPDTVVKATPWRRDPMRALADACRRQGVRFGFYYSHAFDWGEANGVGNDWEHQNPGGDSLLHGRDWWLAAPQLLPRVRRYVDEKAIPQLRELIANYAPDILWFDTPHKLPPEENLRILQAVRAAGPGLVVNGRIVQDIEGGPPARFGDYRSTADRPAEFAPPPAEGILDWEGIPTTNESYGWHQQDHSHKPPRHFVELLAKAAARGGNLLLNVGPRGDGRIDPPDLAILEGIGAWMKDNRSSIAGTTRTPLPVQAWGESTRRGNTLYLHLLNPPRGRRVIVGGLRTPVVRATLLADPKRAPLPTVRLGDLDLSVTLPPRLPEPAPVVVVLETEGPPEADPARLLSGDVARDTLRAFDGELTGGLQYGGGKTRDAWVHGFRRPDQTVRWPVRLREPATFEVAIAYDAPAAAAGGTFVVELGEGRALAGTVAETPAAPVPLGRVALPAGSFTLAVRPTAIRGPELLRLRAIVLTPVAGLARRRP
jgi:alpha-L-fucosidase